MNGPVLAVQAVAIATGGCDVGRDLTASEPCLAIVVERLEAYGLAPGCWGAVTSGDDMARTCTRYGV